MNNLLELKGSFEQRSNKGGFGKPKIPKNRPVKSSKIKNFISDLKSLNTFWLSHQTLIQNALVEIKYSEIVAKSNRIKKLFSHGLGTDDSLIVGARFSEQKTSHIITYCLNQGMLQDAIVLLERVNELTSCEFNGSITSGIMEKIEDFDVDYSDYGLTKTKYCRAIVDLCRIDSVCLPDNSYLLTNQEQNMVSFYKTNTPIDVIFEKLNISYMRRINDQTFLFGPKDIEKIKKEASFLVAMSVVDMTKIAYYDYQNQADDTVYEIQKPTNEPTIGVIDTAFDDHVYFSEWVDYREMIPEGVSVTQIDKRHGTEVTAIIVDGATFNPTLDDNCGNFKVRHFAVATHNRIFISALMDSIRKIIEQNPDIHVWNLSLGAEDEIDDNYISPIASLLDELQYEHDIVFVVAGTNSNSGKSKKIGSPADSINSIVVNSVKKNNEPASYTRNGQVLSFFNKPDICYYGGDTGEELISTDGIGTSYVMGTSFAAPWIARKMSFLIDKLGLSREIAKALLIDSALSWSKEAKSIDSIQKKGYGVVPIKIEDVINSPKDEIKFTISGISEKYDTYNYNIPVPMDNDSFPFVSRATLCYYPKCNRNQGVDYTCTEMDIYFGRLDSKGRIKTINENRQSIEQDTIPSYITEEAARKLYRKWDNVKNIQEFTKKRQTNKKRYDSPFWGISIKTKERLSDASGENLKFGLVVRLKEIYGKNRIDDFIQNCNLRGWIVNRIDINNRVDLYNTLQEHLDIEL